MPFERAIRTLASLACLFGLLSIAAPKICGADAVFDQVTKILAAVDGPGGKKSTTEAAYVRLQQLKPDDRAPDGARRAYLLGLMRLNKRREALQFSAESIERNPNDAPTRLLRARLLLREKSFDEVFVELEAAGKLLAPAVNKVTLDSETEAACRTLGLMFGYLEGPAKPLLKATLGKGVKQHVLADFSTAAQAVFADQYAAVLEEEKELTDKGEAAFKKLQAKHREESEATMARKASLESEKTKTEEQKRLAAIQLTKAWDTAKSDYDTLVSLVLNIQAAQTQLSNQRAQLVSQLSARQPREPRADKNGRVDPADRNAYDRARDEYDRWASQIGGQINRIDQQIIGGDTALQLRWNQGLAAQATLVRLQEAGARLGLEFELKDKAFAHQEARLMHDDPARKRPAAPSKQATQAFTLYDDFNYAQEKQRLLAAVRPGQ